MAKILYGAPVREQIMVGLKKRVEKLGRSPVLVVIQVGNRDDSNVYIKNKIKFGEEIGVTVLHKRYPESIKETELVSEIKKINEDNSVDGIIVQLPLPENLNRENVIGALDPKKDADGLTTSPLEEATLVTPATARGVMALLDFYKIEISGKKIAVIGRSKLAGGPIAEILKERGGEVTVCHRETEDIVSICKNSDILVSATGQAGLVTSEFVRERQVVVDVGINRTPSQPHPNLPQKGRSEKGRESENPFPLERGRGEVLKSKLVGDVLFEEVEPIVSAITPVPGGIGPLTVACLFENLLDLCNHEM